MKLHQAWYVYIVRCRDGTLYTGSTRDVATRVDEHNRSKRGAKYTRSRRPVVIAYQRKYKRRSMALKSEAAIKALPRQEKILLCRLHNNSGDT